ncbi:hypothetical protein [Rubritalea tangerina]|uniref:hypothetical protein n=1 Tax=Rubritalea tangerina TaxID=430798 RepID=UPI0036106777
MDQSHSNQREHGCALTPPSLLHRVDGYSSSPPSWLPFALIYGHSDKYALMRIEYSYTAHY